MKRTLKTMLQRSKRTSADNGGVPGKVLPPKSLQKFVGGDGRKLALCYSAIWSTCADCSPTKLSRCRVRFGPGRASHLPAI